MKLKKLPGRTREDDLGGLDSAEPLHLTPKAQNPQKENLDQLTLIEMKPFCSVTYPEKRLQRQATG